MLRALRNEGILFAFYLDLWYHIGVMEVVWMSEMERIVQEVDSSMKMEGMPLTAADKDRIRRCLTDPDCMDSIIRALVAKHMVPVRARK